MRKFSLKILTIVFVLSVFCVLYLYSRVTERSKYINQMQAPSSLFVSDTYDKVQEPEQIVVSFVVCNSRFNESLNVVKSVLILTNNPILFVIFAEDGLQSDFNETLTKWRRITDNKFEFELHKVSFPEKHAAEWLNLFSKCAAQRLFFPKLLPHIDALIYVDTDTLFLGPAEQMWHYFSQFNSSQISAMALEDENPNISWYPRFAKHPFYGKYGLNSGVMLMNLTRMRTFDWVEYVTPIMLKWKMDIPWGDQDIINILFHFHGGAVRVLPCSANFRPDQCMYGTAAEAGAGAGECAGAAARGVLLLHGSRAAFHDHRQPAFQAIYRAIDEHEMGSDPSQTLVRNMERYLAEAPPSNCGNMRDALLKLPARTITELYPAPHR